MGKKKKTQRKPEPQYWGEFWHTNKYPDQNDSGQNDSLRVHHTGKRDESIEVLRVDHGEVEEFADREGLTLGDALRAVARMFRSRND